MSGKDLTKQGREAVPDLESRLASLRKDVIASEERVLRLGCAKTNETYLVKFKRRAAGDRFTVTEVTKDAPPKPKGWLFDSAPDEPVPVPAKSFNWDEFDLDDFGCPGCGDCSGQTSCPRCKRQMCGANTRRIIGEKSKFFCHPACGANFYTTAATSVTADSSSRPGLPSRDSPKALEAPRLRLTGPQK